ncbi:MAG: hypothetical protein K2W96_25770 [Gemmataceae bacterium]|nr:hypothetical protein [Gemmataceae bacterium]
MTTTRDPDRVLLLPERLGELAARSDGSPGRPLPPRPAGSIAPMLGALAARIGRMREDREAATDLRRQEFMSGG